MHFCVELSNNIDVTYLSMGWVIIDENKFANTEQ